MNASTSDDGFTVVKKSKGRRAKHSRSPHPSSALRPKTAGSPAPAVTQASEDEPDEATVQLRFEQADAEIGASSYLQNVHDVLFKATHGRHPNYLPRHIVCYGLGNFSRCVNARYQLALLTQIRRYLSAETCVAYDPAFTELERNILLTRGIDLLERNEEGKHGVEEPTLFFMPHCGTPLYNSVLWANWTEQALGLVLILGNSFDRIWTNKLDRVLRKKCSFMLNVRSACREYAIVNDFRFADIFNDLALHTFDGALLDSRLWMANKEPFYGKDDEIVLALRKCHV